MKRPGPKKPSAAKATVTTPTKPRATVSELKPKLPKKAAKPIGRVKLAEPKQREHRKLKPKQRERVGLFTKLSPEAKRFVAKSRRRKITALIFSGSFGLLIALILSTMFTPLLAVDTLEVTGTHRIDHKTIVKALSDQIGVPLPMVNPSRIADDLASFALVDTFSVVSLPPHTLRIAIIERQPICIVTVAGVDYLYDPAGVRIGAVSASDNYPRIDIVGDPKGSVEFTAAIDVLLSLPANLLGQIASVDAKSKDDVSMRLRGNAGQRIVWGDGSQSVLKSKVLAALIKNQKKSDYVTFDVSSPTAPVVRYTNF